MNVRHLRFFVALSEERHFGRAAAACHVSQPALSMAISRLEAELGVRLVERGAAGTIGLTDAGRALVDRARHTVRGVDGIAAEASLLRGRLTATLRLGTVPTAVAAAPPLLAPLLRAHPGVRVALRTAPGDALAGAVLRHELDAALVYDDVGASGLRADHLYHERFVLVDAGGREGADDDAVTGRSDAPSGTAEDIDAVGAPRAPDGAAPPETVSWRAVARQPLCLLTPAMQHRAIVDAALRDAGTAATPRIEADSFSTLLGFVRQGWSTVLGRTWLLGQGLPVAVRARPIVDPVVEPSIALISAAAGPPTPVVRALLDTLADADVERLLRSG